MEQRRQSHHKSAFLHANQTKHKDISLHEGSKLDSIKRGRITSSIKDMKAQKTKLGLIMKRTGPSKD
jgi:hypothetical protein